MCSELHMEWEKNPQRGPSPEGSYSKRDTRETTGKDEIQGVAAGKDYELAAWVSFSVTQEGITKKDRCWEWDEEDKKVYIMAVLCKAFWAEERDSADAFYGEGTWRW